MNTVHNPTLTVEEALIALRDFKVAKRTLYAWMAHNTHPLKYYRLANGLRVILYQDLMTYAMQQIDRRNNQKQHAGFAGYINNETVAK